jgi:hypothetical protein
MDTKGLITVQNIVDDCLVERDDFSDKDVLRYTRFAERCITKMSVFSLPNVTTVTLPINPNIKTAPLPCDFIRCIRLGVKLNNGRIYTLTEDLHLGLFDEEICEEETTETPAPSPSFGIGYTDYYDSTFQSWKYAIRGGVSEYGTYRIDQKNERIVLDPNVQIEEVILEYTSSGIKKGGTTYVPEIARESIIAFIKWKDAKTSGKTINETRVLKLEYYEELTSLDEALAPSMSVIYDALLNGYSQLATR